MSTMMTKKKANTKKPSRQDGAISLLNNNTTPSVTTTTTKQITPPSVTTTATKQITPPSVTTTTTKQATTHSVTTTTTKQITPPSVSSISYPSMEENEPQNNPPIITEATALPDNDPIKNNEQAINPVATTSTEQTSTPLEDPPPYVPSIAPSLPPYVPSIAPSSSTQITTTSASYPAMEENETQNNSQISAEATALPAKTPINNEEQATNQAPPIATNTKKNYETINDLILENNPEYVVKFNLGKGSSSWKISNRYIDNRSNYTFSPRSHPEAKFHFFTKWNQDDQNFSIPVETPLYTFKAFINLNKPVSSLLNLNISNTEYIGWKRLLIKPSSYVIGTDGHKLNITSHNNSSFHNITLKNKYEMEIQDEYVSHSQKYDLFLSYNLFIARNLILQNNTLYISPNIRDYPKIVDSYHNDNYAPALNTEGNPCICAVTDDAKGLLSMFPRKNPFSISNNTSIISSLQKVPLILLFKHSYKRDQNHDDRELHDIHHHEHAFNIDLTYDGYLSVPERLINNFRISCDNQKGYDKKGELLFTREEESYQYEVLYKFMNMKKTIIAQEPKSSWRSKSKATRNVEGYVPEGVNCLNLHKIPGFKVDTNKNFSYIIGRKLIESPFFSIHVCAPHLASSLQLDLKKVMDEYPTLLDHPVTSLTESEFAIPVKLADDHLTMNPGHYS